MESITWDDNPWTVSECIDSFELFRSSKSITLDFFHKMSGFMVSRAFSKKEFTGRLSQLLVDVCIADSISDAMRKIKTGSVKVNCIQVKDINHIVVDLFENHWILIQHGKSQAGIVFVESEDFSD